MGVGCGVAVGDGVDVGSACSRVPAGVGGKVAVGLSVRDLAGGVTMGILLSVSVATAVGRMSARVGVTVIRLVGTGDAYSGCWKAATVGSGSELRPGASAGGGVAGVAQAADKPTTSAQAGIRMAVFATMFISMSLWLFGSGWCDFIVELRCGLCAVSLGLRCTSLGRSAMACQLLLRRPTPADVSQSGV